MIYHQVRINRVAANCATAVSESYEKHSASPNRFCITVSICSRAGIVTGALNKSLTINNPDASVEAQCSMFRTVCTIRHGCRWFQTETSFLLCKKLAVKNVQGCIFLTRWLQSRFIPLLRRKAPGYEPLRTNHYLSVSTSCTVKPVTCTIF